MNLTSPQPSQLKTKGPLPYTKWHLQLIPFLVTEQRHQVQKCPGDDLGSGGLTKRPRKGGNEIREGASDEEIRALLSKQIPAPEDVLTLKARANNAHLQSFIEKMRLKVTAQQSKPFVRSTLKWQLLCEKYGKLDAK